MADAQGAEVTREQLVDGLTLANIYCTRIVAQLERSDAPDSFAVNLEPSYRVESDRIDYLFAATCEPRSTDGDRVAVIEVSIIVTFDLDEAIEGVRVPSALIEWVGANLAAFTAYPYIREALQGIATRIGISNMTMDLLKRDEPLPDGLSFGSSVSP